MDAKWKVLIADDEPAARRGVRQLLAAHPEFEVAGTCRNGAEVLAALDESTPDVVFLDIQMPGLNGFEVIRRRTTARMPEVVFLSAYGQFALQAFEAEALDYLVKPVSQARFDDTIRRLRKRLHSRTRPSENEYITVPTSRGMIVLSVNEIDWIEAAGNYSQLWVGSRSYLVRQTLGVMARRLSKYLFIRAHRQALVKLENVRELTRDKSGGLSAVLSSGTRIPISRRRRSAFASAVGELCLGKKETQ